MADLLKIYHELIVEYREPDCFFSLVENEKKSFFSLLKNFELQLDKKQLRVFKKLKENAIKVIFHELKKYYFLGVDANKKSDE